MASGCVVIVASTAQTIWVVDAHREVVVHSDGPLSAFAEKRQAIEYAETRACFRSGEIRILDSTGNLEATIAFDDADRKLRS
ncbi:MAG: hypothetical protein DME65_07005 [Verrucomicrobia bacterium]|nr:MAG: hypothetical protein DME65_07005 [Verrucomicrobiota bacterium]